MKRSSALLAALLSLTITACSEQSNKSTTEITDKSEIKANISTQVVDVESELPTGDVDTPDNQYAELNDGNQLMFLYYAISSLPIDYEKIADSYVKEYRYNQDEFKKRDILESVKPKIDAEIKKAKNTRYLRFRVSDSSFLSEYDFNQKAFKQNAITENTRFNYSNSSYQLSFNNALNFEKVFVDDEAKARQIANLRRKYNGMTLDVYFFAQDVGLSDNAVKGQILKMVIKTADGLELIVK